MSWRLEIEGLDKVSRDAEEILFHVKAIRKIADKIGYEGAGKLTFVIDGPAPEIKEK